LTLLPTCALSDTQNQEAAPAGTEALREAQAVWALPLSFVSLLIGDVFGEGEVSAVAALPD